MYLRNVANKLPIDKALAYKKNLIFNSTAVTDLNVAKLLVCTKKSRPPLLFQRTTMGPLFVSSV
jgi:hypothetical protein